MVLTQSSSSCVCVMCRGARGVSVRMGANGAFYGARPGKGKPMVFLAAPADLRHSQRADGPRGRLARAGGTGAGARSLASPGAGRRCGVCHLCPHGDGPRHCQQPPGRCHRDADRAGRSGHRGERLCPTDPSPAPDDVSGYGSPLPRPLGSVPAHDSRLAPRGCAARRRTATASGRCRYAGRDGWKWRARLGQRAGGGAPRRCCSGRWPPRPARAILTGERGRELQLRGRRRSLFLPASRASRSSSARTTKAIIEMSARIQCALTRRCRSLGTRVASCTHSSTVLAIGRWSVGSPLGGTLLSCQHRLCKCALHQRRKAPGVGGTATTVTFPGRAGLVWRTHSPTARGTDTRALRAKEARRQ